MKTTRYTLLAAALLLAASCANDPVEDITNPSAPGTALPGGTFVIDYAAGMEGADTRSDANQSIQSLDYLIYQSTTEDGDYTLLKKRSIPDINETTTWPLTRNDMTWEQREALKDTLSTSHYYKMVFVANANDTIWNEDDTSEENKFHALQKVEEGDNFNDGRLVLPPRVFKENDMYYMWSNSENPLNGNDYTDNKTASQKIVLKRMINKVEVKLKLDENIPTDKTELETFIDEKVSEYYTDLIAANYGNEAKAGKLYNSMKDCMEKLAEGLDNSNHSHAQFNNAVDKMEERIKGETFVGDMVTQYLSTSNKANIKTEIEEHLKELYNKYCDWTQADKVELVHAEGESYANAIDFDRTTHGSKDKDELQYELIDNSFTFYIFGNNSANETVLNQISEFNFYKDNEQAESGKELKFSISGETFPIDKHEKGNQHLIFKCNPIGITTSAFGNIDTEEQSNEYKITSFSLPDQYGNWTDEDFGFWGARDIEEFEEELNEGSTFDSNYIEFDKNNNGIKNMTLKIKCPEVSFSATWTE